MEPTNQSATFATLERINKKIASLRSRLSPILLSLPATAKEEGRLAQTTLLSKIKEIEDGIDSLNDSIEL